MFRMAVGHSEDVDPDDAVREVLDQCREALGGERPQAGLLFSTYDTDPVELVTGIGEGFPDLDLIGSTASGEMSSVLGFQEDSVTLALFASDTIDVTAGLGTGLSSDPADAARRAVAEARGKTDKEPRLCVAVPSVARHDPSDLLQNLRRELGEDVAVLGGGAAPRQHRDDTMTAYQFFRGRVLHDALPILLFSGPLAYSYGVDTGWKGVGRTATVTRAAGAVLHEIDGKPALEFYEHYLGTGARPTAANPLAVTEPDSDDVYLRVPIGYDPESGAITLAGTLREGATVQLTVAITEEIVEGTASAIAKAIKGYPEGSSPDAALVFSCAVRKLMLGSRTGTEIEITRRELGPGVPVCGFYAFGEIAPSEAGVTRYHNETIVALLLGTE